MESVALTPAKAEGSSEADACTITLQQLPTRIRGLSGGLISSTMLRHIRYNRKTAHRFSDSALLLSKKKGRRCQNDDFGAAVHLDADTVQTRTLLFQQSKGVGGLWKLRTYLSRAATHDYFKLSDLSVDYFSVNR